MEMILLTFMLHMSFFHFNKLQFQRVLSHIRVYILIFDIIQDLIIFERYLKQCIGCSFSIIKLNNYKNLSKTLINNTKTEEWRRQSMPYMRTVRIYKVRPGLRISHTHFLLGKHGFLLIKKIPTEKSQTHYTSSNANRYKWKKQVDIILPAENLFMCGNFTNSTNQMFCTNSFLFTAIYCFKSLS